MTQENIIRMAVTCQLVTTANRDGVYMEALEAFAALVEEAATEAANARANTSWALMCKKMVAAEKEACAKAVDHILKEGGGTWGDAIRARGQA